MVGLRTAATLPLAVGILFSLPLSACSSGPPPIAALEKHINEHAKATLVDGDLVTRYTTLAMSNGECSLTLIVTSTDDVADMREEVTLQLAALTPEVSVQALDQPSDVWTVRAETILGDESLTHHRRSRVPPEAPPEEHDVPYDFVEVEFPSKQLAEEGARLLGESVAHCGGRKRPATVAAQYDSAARAKADLEERLVQQCQRLVLAALVAPGSAKFPDEATVLPMGKRDTLNVSGKVDSQNRFGALIRKNYSCNFRRERGAWVPARSVLIY